MHTYTNLYLAHPLETWAPFDIVVNSAYALLTMTVTYKPTNVVISPFIRYSGTSAYNSHFSQYSSSAGVVNFLSKETFVEAKKNISSPRIGLWYLYLLVSQLLRPEVVDRCTNPSLNGVRRRPKAGMQLRLRRLQNLLALMLRLYSAPLKIFVLFGMESREISSCKSWYWVWDWHGFGHWTHHILLHTTFRSPLV